MSLTIAFPRATLADLMRVEGKAELIDGRIVRYMATGFRPSRVAARIYRQLDDHAEKTGRGLAFTDGTGFAVPELSTGRESFSPDAAYYTGPLPTNPMEFIRGAPDFAVEVRSENDYGPAAETEMAAKRAEYFEAGTLVVWDVDPVAGVVRRYRPDGSVAEFAAGAEADAEPAVPGWRLSIDWLMA
jgi:Uma2 family endonuclease